jgi:hypothetical protein
MKINVRDENHILVATLRGNIAKNLYRKLFDEIKVKELNPINPKKKAFQLLDDYSIGHRDSEQELVVWLWKGHQIIVNFMR